MSDWQGLKLGEDAQAIGWLNQAPTNPAMHRIVELLAQHNWRPKIVRYSIEQKLGFRISPRRKQLSRDE